MKCQDLTGKKFGNLTVISKSDSINRKSYWICKCDCGNKTIVRASNLKSGHTKSCGCYKKTREIEANTVHGLSNTRIHRIWDNIKTRCLNKNSPAFRLYGGRGITICEEWKNSFIEFYQWAISSGYSDKLSIDRIDTNGNYCPDNCRWVSMKVQQNNRTNNRILSIGDTSHTLAEWSEISGKNEWKIRYALKHGKTIEEILR